MKSSFFHPLQKNRRKRQMFSPRKLWEPSAHFSSSNSKSWMAQSITIGSSAPREKLPRSSLLRAASIWVPSYTIKTKSFPCCWSIIPWLKTTSEFLPKKDRVMSSSSYSTIFSDRNPILTIWENSSSSRSSRSFGGDFSNQMNTERSQKNLPVRKEK